MVAALALFACLFAVLALGLYLLGGRPSRHRAETWIDATPAEVFPWLHEPQRLGQWLSGFVESRPTSDGPIRVGSESLDVFEENGRRIEMRTTVTTFDPGTALAVRIASPMLDGETSYRLRASSGGTGVRFEGTFRYRGITRCFAPFLGAVVARRQESDLARLKQAIEGHAEHGA